MRRPCSEQVRCLRLGSNNVPNFYAMSKVNPLPESPQVTNVRRFLTLLDRQTIPQVLKKEKGPIDAKLGNIYGVDYKALVGGHSLNHQYVPETKSARSTAEYLNNLNPYGKLPSFAQELSNKLHGNLENLRMSSLQEYSLSLISFSSLNAPSNLFSESESVLERSLLLHREKLLRSRLWELNNMQV